MRDKNERNAELLLDILQLLLHILAQLQIECGKRFVKKQHLRLQHKGARDGNTLLLTAGEARYVSLFKALQVYEPEHFRHLLADLLLRHLAHPETIRDVFVYVVVRKQGITLKNGVDLPFVRRHTIHAFAVKKHFAAVRFEKARDEAEGRRFAAARGAEQCDKFAVPDRQIQIVQNLLAIEFDGDIFERNDSIVFHFLHPPLRPKTTYSRITALREPQPGYNRNSRKECVQNGSVALPVCVPDGGTSRTRLQLRFHRTIPPRQGLRYGGTVPGSRTGIEKNGIRRENCLV